MFIFVFVLLKRGLVRSKLLCVKEVLKLAMFKLLKHLKGIRADPWIVKEGFCAVACHRVRNGFSFTISVQTISAYCSHLAAIHSASAKNIGH